MNSLTIEQIKTIKHISKKLKVLYIEDDLTLQYKTSKLLGNFFKNIDIANDGQEGLEKYLVYKKNNNIFYDIVITDFKMPYLDGKELIKDIFNINIYQKVIITSAFSEPEDLIDFINLGVSKFIPKPFSSKQIIEVLATILEIDSANSENYLILGKDLLWDKMNLELTYNERLIKLNRNQTAFLNLFITNPNKIFTNEELFKMMPGGRKTNGKEILSIDSVKSNIKRLRQKIPVDIIENIYSKGYKLKDPRGL